MRQRRLPKPTPRKSRQTLQAFVFLVILAATGCASNTEGAASAAQDFQNAVEASDWTEACSLLQPDAREQVAKQGGGSCEAGLESLQMQPAGSLLRTEAYGREAIVEFDGGAVFVAASGTSWRITAAGCLPAGDSPYSCEVGGK